MSKITRPILTGVFPRKRLFNLLDRMRKQPLIWVSGPPGSGKTTLIASYLDAHNLPCLWYQIDEGDADPATFFYYMGQAAKKASPRMHKSLPLLTPEYFQDVPTFTYRYFEGLYDLLIPFLAKEGKRGFFLVFDNYHEVQANSPLHEIILNGLSRIPEGINMLFISRSEPPPALIRLRANNLMNVIGWNELRLNLGESTGMIRLRSKKKISQETIKHLNEMADGWAAGLVLMLESLRRGIQRRIFEKHTPDEILDYFVTELFDKTDKELQEFLLKTALLPKITGKMAEELTGLSQGSRILSTLNKINYFTEMHLHHEPIYQYHPLFREFLLSRAKSTFSERDLSSLCSRAAALLEEDGHIEAALSLLRDSSDWEGLAQLIAKHAPLMIVQGRYHPLKDWLKSLPMEILESNPWLLYWMGSCRLPFDPLSARSFFEKAFEQFKLQENVAGIFLGWSGIVESIWFDLSDFKLFDQWISVLEELLRTFKEFPSKEIEARVALSMFTALLIRQPQPPEIELWSERMLASLESYTNVSAKIMALSRQVLYRMFTGEYVKLGLAADSLRKLAQSRHASPLARLTTKFAETIFYRYTGSHERCLNAISDGFELSRRSGIRMLDRMFLFHGALSALGINDIDKANEFLGKLEESSTNSKPWDTSFYHILKTRMALVQGHPEEASVHAEMALKISLDVGSPLSLFMSHLINFHAMHQMGKDREALEHLNKAFHLTNLIYGKNAKFYVLIAKALFTLDQGEEELCVLSLKKALSIGKEGKYFDTYIDQPSTMVRLCSKALEAGIEVEYVRELIKKRNLTSEKPPPHIQNWPWPLEIYTLGRFKLLKDGKPIRFSKKIQRKPIDLIKVMIAFGGREVREDQIEDALWPEADGDAAHHSFEMTLHRLRKLIGNENAIGYQEGRVTLNPRYCWVDLWAFDHILELIDDKQRGEMTKTVILSAQKAIELYKGPFLAGEVEQSWMVSIRERLRRKFLKNLNWLGHYWEENDQWEKALECYEHGLEMDELAEELYRRLMMCYHRLGRRAEALSVYHRCKRTLSASLGIEPSSDTEATYRTILHQNR